MNIKEKIKYLPDKDIAFAEKFINGRDFESLYDIVHSDHVIHNKKKNNDGFFENPEDQRLDEILSDLEGDTLSYIHLIEPEYTSYQEDQFDDCFAGEDVDW